MKSQSFAFRLCSRWVIAGAAVLLAGQAWAERPLLKVSQEVDVAAKPAVVWAVVGQFGELAWHPAVAATTLTSGNGKSAGSVRKVSVKGGGEIDEKLLQRNAKAHSLRYAILASPLPVSDYVSQLEVRPAAGGHSLVRWSSEFRRKDETPTAGADDAGAQKIVGGIYESGLQALQQRFAGAK